jgi:hypothetical protein
VATFRLLAPHNFNTSRGPALYEAGTTIASHEVLDFRATALMQALDSEAETMLADECARLRMIADSNITSTERACLPGVGPVQRLPY